MLVTYSSSPFLSLTLYNIFCQASLCLQIVILTQALQMQLEKMLKQHNTNFKFQLSYFNVLILHETLTKWINSGIYRVSFSKIRHFKNLGSLSQ